MFELHPRFQQIKVGLNLWSDDVELSVMKDAVQNCAMFALKQKNQAE